MQPHSANGAVVMGACPTGLGVIRNLGRHGIPVWVIDPYPTAVGYYSKYAKVLGTYGIPADHEKLLQRLILLGKESEQKPVLFPASDIYLDFVAANCQELSRFFLFYRIDKEVMKTFLDKKTFYKICCENGIDIARTFFLNDDIDISCVAQMVDYPVIIKPIYTHIWDRVFKGIKALPVNNRAELEQKYGLLQSYGMCDNILVQEIIPGPDRQIMVFAAYFDRDSKPHSIFTGRKIRQFPPNFGTAAMVKAERNQEIADMSISFLRKLHFHGICDVEFKEDPRDKIFKIIEINPRIGRWFSVLDGCGLDLPYTAYRDAIGQPIIKNKAQDDRITWIYAFKDILSGYHSIRKREISLRQWLHSWKGKRTWAIYASDDKMPFVASGLAMSYRLWGYFKGKMRLN